MLFKVDAQFLNVTNWAKLLFLAANLAQLVTFNLGQLVTFKNDHLFAIFRFFLCAEIPIFVVFEHQPKFAQKRGPSKNDNFSHLAKHEKTVLLQPPS